VGNPSATHLTVTRNASEPDPAYMVNPNTVIQQAQSSNPQPHEGQAELCKTWSTPTAPSANAAASSSTTGAVSPFFGLPRGPPAPCLLFLGYLAEVYGKPLDHMGMSALNFTITWPSCLTKMLLYVPWLHCLMKLIRRSFVTLLFPWKAPMPLLLLPPEPETRKFEEEKKILRNTLTTKGLLT